MVYKTAKLVDGNYSGDYSSQIFLHSYGFRYSEKEDKKLRAETAIQRLNLVKDIGLLKVFPIIIQ